jgi:hypothetical protein
MLINTTILNFKYKQALKSFGRIFNAAKPKERHEFIFPMRIAGLTFKQARELGFNVSFRLWQSCLNQRKRNIGKKLNRS